MTLLLGSWVEVAARTRYSAGTAPELGVGLIFSSLLVVSLREKKNKKPGQGRARQDGSRKERKISSYNLIWFQHNLSETTKDLCNLRFLVPGVCQFLVLCNLEKNPKVLTLFC